MKVFFACGLLAVTAFQMSADEPWRWTEDPSAERYVQAVEIAGLKADLKPSKTSDVTITVRHPDGKAIYRWQGHRYSSFVAAERNLFVVAYSPYSAGVVLLAIETATGRVAWQNNLPQELPAVQSKYSNRVNLNYADGRLLIYSKQTLGDGRFWWVVNAADGRLIETHPNPARRR
jgi:hypothetical protein